MAPREASRLLPPEPTRSRRRLASRNLRVIRPGVPSLFSAEVVVGITVHDDARTIRRCLESVLDQAPACRAAGIPFGTVVLDDGSRDGWEEHCEDLLERLSARVVRGRCGSPGAARNAVLDHVRSALPNVRWVARLDADDRLASPHSLERMVFLARERSAGYVLGGNRLVRGGSLIQKTNPASTALFDPGHLLPLLRAMADGTAENELPSCNLLLSPHGPWRYPETGNAEDHWLVAALLLNHPEDGAILEDDYYADYTLGGAATEANREAGVSRQARVRIAEAAEAWVRSRSAPGRVLGYGREGVVRLVDGFVEKHFFSWPLEDDHVLWLRETLRDVSPYLPEPLWEKRDGRWVARYPYAPTESFDGASREAVKAFLTLCLERRLVCQNVKRPNLRRRPDGGLLYVDVGADVVPMDVDRFRDAAARLYVIGVLEWPDGELRRRRTERRQTDLLREVPGFESFYAEVLEARARALWASGAERLPSRACAPEGSRAASERTDEPPTLLIKACPMDAGILEAQVRHIVAQLERPRPFAEKVLALDPHPGPYPRPYAEPDPEGLLASAESLREEGVVDRVLVAPSDTGTAAAVNERWFGIPSTETHTVGGVPLVPQLWAFEQVQTRYVLQCDVDVLIGRRDHRHDYLAEMLNAVPPEDVLGAAFNIPHPPGEAFRPYDAAPGDFVPEVRCGLLDLDRMRDYRPYPNERMPGEERLERTWYRSVQRCQRSSGLRTVRGGSPSTFYVHPRAPYKRDAELFARIRDLVSQGHVPPVQHGAWDLQGDGGDWAYERRREQLVFIVRGRNTESEKVRRCVASLLAQRDQRFGVVVVDDGSGPRQAAMLSETFAPLAGRVTLVCNPERRGHIANTLQAIGELCADPGTLVAVLDLDDALMDEDAAAILNRCREKGHDVVIGGMYRPDKPLKVYHPDFERPRQRYGGEVWVHLRAFTKGLFDRLPPDALILDGDWVSHCEDYAIMVPIVELASSPLYEPTYLYFHERSTPACEALRTEKDIIIRRLLSKPRACPAHEMERTRT